MTKLTGSLGVRNEINVDIIGTGARGKEGESAYEIWLDLGNEGTEQEYLASLKGQDGDVGPKGDKGDTGEQGPRGLQGPKGDPFVYENFTPTQLEGLKGPKGDKGDKGDTPIKGVDYWTAADQEAIVSDVLAAAGSYELIETITLTDNVASIVRTQEPDGTPYKFKAIGVVVSAEIGSINSGINVLANYNATRLNSAFINGAISTSIKKYGYAQLYSEFGVWTAIGSTSVNGFGWTVTQMTGYSPGQAFSVKESENPYCTQMVMQVNTADATIPAGTVISIYGVRA